MGKLVVSGSLSGKMTPERIRVHVMVARDRMRRAARDLLAACDVVLDLGHADVTDATVTELHAIIDRLGEVRERLRRSEGRPGWSTHSPCKEGS